MGEEAHCAAPFPRPPSCEGRIEYGEEQGWGSITSPSLLNYVPIKCWQRPPIAT